MVSNFQKVRYQPAQNCAHRRNKGAGRLGAWLVKKRLAFSNKNTILSVAESTKDHHNSYANRKARHRHSGATAGAEERRGMSEGEQKRKGNTKGAEKIQIAFLYFAEL